jgi:hypothetical protein
VMKPHAYLVAFASRKWLLLRWTGCAVGPNRKLLSSTRRWSLHSGVSASKSRVTITDRPFDVMNDD